jgi:hypothetical protein
VFDSGEGAFFCIDSSSFKLDPCAMSFRNQVT